MRTRLLIVGALLYASSAFGQAITDGNGGSNAFGLLPRSILSDSTVTGDSVGKHGAYGLTPAATFTATPTATPTNTPTPTSTPTNTPTPTATP